jgi:crossover junction endodeoxyribonuclease RuvC
MKRLCIGIDNGLLGAITVIDESFKLVGWWDTPIVNLGKKGKTKNEFLTAEMGKILGCIVGGLPDTVQVMAWLEQAHAMPKQGLSSTFKTGRGFGLWEGILIGMGIKYDIVHPRRWTKEMLKDMPAGDPKMRSMLKCQRLFPEIPLTTPRGKKLTMDGRADSAMIAYYGMLQMQGKEAPNEPKRSTKTPPPRRVRRRPSRT